MGGVVRVTVQLLATWFGTGRSRHLPGTVGTLGALPLVWAVSQWGVVFYMGFTLVFTLAAIQVCQWYEEQKQSHDAAEVVIDEVAGFLIAMTWVPFTWLHCGLAFVLFRALDIRKPFPISYLDQNVKGGFGVVVDDVAAGLVTNMVLQYAMAMSWI